MLDLNNFYSYFPGGHRFEREYDSPIISDLQILIDIHGLDVEKLKEEKRLWSLKLKQGVEIAKKGYDLENPELQRLNEESLKHRDNVQRMIFPFYVRMRALGYSHNEITC